jgi:hypothetical protein
VPVNSKRCGPTISGIRTTGAEICFETSRIGGPDFVDMGASVPTPLSSVVSTMPLPVSALIQHLSIIVFC